MQNQKSSSFIGTLMRWFVPLAALLVLAAFLFITPPGLLGKADGIGYAVCHRIDERSFHILGRQLPLCARCTGEFNAAAISLIFLGFVSRKRSSLPSKGILAVLALFFVAFGVDGSNSYLYSAQTGLSGLFAANPQHLYPEQYPAPADRQRDGHHDGLHSVSGGQPDNLAGGGRSSRR